MQRGQTHEQGISHLEEMMQITGRIMLANRAITILRKRPTIVDIRLIIDVAVL